MKKKKIWLRITFIVVIILFAASFYHLPYYVESPGSAEKLAPIVKVENGYKEKGNFMLTTVRLGPANIYSYVLAKMSKHEDVLPLDQIMPKDQTEEEYNVYQLYLMDNSKHTAIQVAYSKAHKPYHFNYKGVYVLSVDPSMPAAKALNAGDQITEVDGHRFESSAQFIKYVGGKKVGQSIRISYIRDGKENSADIKLAEFKKPKGKVGIGIGLVDDRDLITSPPVTVKTDNIGGPSAGLMFSLEIYNQLTKQDLTKGYQIAGTGEIAPDGEVGRIGGIDKKVVAADKEGAEIFFAPNDEITPDMKKEEPGIQSNYQEALKAAREIGTKMKIVPVKTFDDALNYLNGLKAK
ncbi:SepM family pheromone-processing serine protease [Heyndrickxia acidicola]|uniref:endopeptidase La n=1 Tax=Heyndrickxia acidicola TaxID=209389 RepID=A0ABU6MGM2_9BACI|nr:SepM family pheromone-processing serine protease [Heyndrickxia acidicola]MED1202185.1 SepM family pheromone-processing serine protease [Heyndrickxia acidicola]